MTGKLPRGTPTKQFPEQDLNKDMSADSTRWMGECWKVRPQANNGCWERGNQCSFHVKQPLFLWKLQVRSKICLAIFPLSLLPTCEHSFFHHQRSCQSDEGFDKWWAYKDPSLSLQVHSCCQGSFFVYILGNWRNIQWYVYPCNNMIVYNTFHARRFSFSLTPHLYE